MTSSPHLEPAATAPGGSQWLLRPGDAINADFSQRAVSLPEHALWQPSCLPGVQLRLLEYVPGATTRLTAQARLDAWASPINLEQDTDLEVLVQRGSVIAGEQAHTAGSYIRLPFAHRPDKVKLQWRCVNGQFRQAQPALLYVATGQMPDSDTEVRCVDTDDQSRWLPGPVDGTEVLPLHGHGSGNVMLIRWTATSAFKPRLDPLGEELLVLRGALHDACGHYAAGSWIRNPVEAWQSWGAKSGTVVYYKNGHFGNA